MSVSSRIVAGVRRVRHLGAELWSDGRGPILVAVAGGWFLSLGVRMISWRNRPSVSGLDPEGEGRKPR